MDDVCVINTSIFVLYARNSGPVRKGTNHVPKAVSERDSDPFLILPFVNAKLTQMQDFEKRF